ncbi:toxin-antitoxin system HicB family antitoxin [Nonomuraea sp. ATR24]|uniref:toxin-antitoxin system HicB family antitoxin n=1 Tax=Nonomuraea TaxID=83681 RepID=UPI001C5CD4D1|nr:toxin-antitoxin system HicB family antitoxin [Nonomuraea ceibae]
MNLTPFVDQLRRELAVAAEAGGPEARELAERLTAPLESAVRLTLLDALSTAAGEITRDLAPGSVDVRLRGRDADFVVRPAHTPPAPASPQSTLRSALAGAVEVAMGVRAPVPDADEGGTSRISLRVPEHLKSRIEEAAGHDGLSVNAWLVRAISAALEPGEAVRSDDPPGGRHYTGWVS